MDENLWVCDGEIKNCAAACCVCNLAALIGTHTNGIDILNIYI